MDWQPLRPRRGHEHCDGIPSPKFLIAGSVWTLHDTSTVPAARLSLVRLLQTKSLSLWAISSALAPGSDLLPKWREPNSASQSRLLVVRLSRVVRSRRAKRRSVAASDAGFRIHDLAERLARTGVYALPGVCNDICHRTH